MSDDFPQETGDSEAKLVPVPATDANVDSLLEWLDESPHTGAWGVVGGEIVRGLRDALAAERVARAAAEKERDRAREELTMLRSAWNHHFKTWPHAERQAEEPAA